VGKTYLETEYEITTVRRNQSEAATTVGTVENKTDMVRNRTLVGKLCKARNKKILPNGGQRKGTDQESTIRILLHVHI
jgi:hypothetical protein